MKKTTTPDRVYLMRAAWHWVKATGERPCRRTIQDMLKRNLGKGFYDHEVAAWLRANQFTGSDGQPHLVPNPDAAKIEHQRSRARGNVGPSGLAQVSHKLSTASAQFSNGKSNNHAAKNLLPAQSPHKPSTSYAVEEREVRYENVGVNTPSSRVCAHASINAMEGTRRTSTEGVTPDVPQAAEPLPVAPAPPAFGAQDEPRVARLLAAMAAEGAIDASALRAEMQQQLGKVGGERWRHGIDIAITANPGRGNRWRYAQGVMARYQPEEHQGRQNGKPRHRSPDLVHAPQDSGLVALLEARGRAFAAEVEAGGRRRAAEIAANGAEKVPRRPVAEVLAARSIEISEK